MRLEGEWHGPIIGGGFYHIQKYLVAPDKLPDHLIWHKWQSYWTWISGFMLLVLVYYVGAEFYLIDLEKMDLQVWQAVGISMASLGFGWVIYDQLCKSRFGEDNTRLMVFLFVLLVIMAWGYTQMFYRPRRAFAFGRVHRHHHVGQCVLHHYPEPEDRCGRSESGPGARCQIRQDRQATFDP